MRQAFFIVFVSLLTITAAATEEPRKRIQMNTELMEFLAGEPVVNKGSDGELTQIPIQTESLIAQGLSVYKNHCAVCHGANLEGQKNWEQPDSTGLLPAPPHDDAGHTWHHADDQLFEIVKYGPAVAMGDATYTSGMPAFSARIPDDDILAVLVYIRSTWSEPKRKWQQGANAAQSGAAWWQESDD